MEPGEITAVIDVGSNSIRLLVARALSPLAFEVVDEERFDARLGEGHERGQLSDEAMARGLRAFEIMAEVARSHQPVSILAVGTEALRRATNGGDFVERARERTGVRFRLLSGQEEALYAFLGVANSTAFSEGYLLDIGGGSLELIQVERRAVKLVQSVPLGAIYARERYFSSDPPASREVRALRKAVRQQLNVEATGGALYGTGGAVRNLARMARLQTGYPLRRLHGFEIPKRQLHRIANQLVRVSDDARRKLPGVGANRADTLHAAAVVIDELMDLTGADRLAVSGQGLREGLVWQELRDEAAVLADVRTASINGLARANGVDLMAAEPVIHVAATLFAATAEVHGFGPKELDLLLHAARLAGIGMHVDYYSRDRHAEYLVHSGDLHGFSHREIVLLAALVRWAEGGTPDLSAYGSIMEPDDTRRVNVLSLILGLARAVRRRFPSPVLGISAQVKRETLKLQLRSGSSLAAEIYQLEQQQRRLESVLKLGLSVEAAPARL